LPSTWINPSGGFCSLYGLPLTLRIVKLGYFVLFATEFYVITISEGKFNPIILREQSIGGYYVHSTTSTGFDDASSPNDQKPSTIAIRTGRGRNWYGS
jgi:hypothetical protein